LFADTGFIFKLIYIEEEFEQRSGVAEALNYAVHETLQKYNKTIGYCETLT